MENNEISLELDVKLDLKDKKTDVSGLRNWTKCDVKIEAIKCFPCYFRITFTNVSEVEKFHTLCVRINMPGLSVRLATSRSRTYSYGLFWKQNRKRCCIFFGFDSQLSCERHMKWMKKSIKNLELHRQEILETRRLSRSKPELQTINGKQVHEFDGKDTKVVRDVLGPLPKIPDFCDSNWSRRMSGMSGIYEEIPDGFAGSRRQSRNSFASGIYEEMKPVSTFERIRESLSLTPPPLPPRTRINTFLPDTGEISRSHTNPESDLAKKKKYLTILENMFGLSRRSGGSASSKESLKGSPDKIKKRKNAIENIKLSSKRNSFSSPDLSKLNYFESFEALDDLSSISSELYMMGIEEVNASDEFIVMSPKDYEKSKMKKTDKNETNPPDLNISEQIQPNFNFSCNMSSVNLVGANLNTEKNSSVEILNDFSGYCVMAPIKRDKTKIIEKETEISTVSSQQDGNVYEQMNALSGIHLSREKDHSHTSFEPIYQNFRGNKLIGKSHSSKEDNDSFVGNLNEFDADIYENMSGIGSVLCNNKHSETAVEDVNPMDAALDISFTFNDSITSESREKERSSPDESDQSFLRRKSSSLDDKIPSYYPNDSDILRNRRRSSLGNQKCSKNLNGIKSARKDNLNTVTVENGNSQNEIINSDVPKRRYTGGIRRNAPMIKANKTSGNLYVVTKVVESSITQSKVSEVVALKVSKAPVENIAVVENEIKENNEDNNLKPINIERSPRLYQKYATLARITPNKYLEKCAKKSSEISSLKKFTSLPRFKKIDFSPLRAKITNVLQRHNSDGF